MGWRYLLCIDLCGGCIAFFLVLIWGHWRPPSSESGDSLTNTNRTEEKKPVAIWLTLRQKLPRRLIALATYVVPIYIAVFLLNGAGLFDWMRQWFSRWVVISFVPVESLSFVALSFTAEFLSQKIRETTDPQSRDKLIQAISNGSVITWQHINLLGEYDFSEERLKDSIGIKLPNFGPPSEVQIWGGRIRPPS